ncbi:MAG: hypothetical protein ISS76_09595 [Phycisphaerae bacterium]|nr:hypothetical protein [Phycisphaerae bacterium]
MRNVVGLSAVLLICVALSSCSGNRPEKAFMGTWKGTHEGETIELSFMEKNLCIAKEGEGTHAGTWSIDPDGNVLMTFEDAKVIATLTKQGQIIAREESGSEAIVFEKIDEKKK